MIIFTKIRIKKIIGNHPKEKGNINTLTKGKTTEDQQIYF
jgi:hypothetical protein